MVIIGGILHENPFFVPSEQMLQELDARKQRSARACGQRLKRAMQPSAHPASELESLSQTTRDLVAMTTLPAIWGDLPPQRVAERLADVLMRTLDLDLIELRLLPGADSDGFETVRSKRPGEAPPPCASAFRFGIGGEIGTLVARSRRPDFPTQNERLLLGVAVNQATVVFQRHLTERALKRGEAQFLSLADTAPLSHLINDLLDIARVTDGKVDIEKSLVDLKSIVSNAVETSLPLIEKGHHELRLKLHDAPLPVVADAARIAQVVGNLLTNAAKYTPHGGTIKLTVDQDGADAVISVADSGIGIPAESLETVFDMFSQVGRNMEHAQGGLGIGLSLVRQLVSLHEGTVVASSEGPGKGSTFVVRLALARAGTGALAGIAAADVPGKAARALRVLVADDNVDAAATLATLLEMSGHELRIAHDGPQALLLAAQFLPQVAFLDIGMPGMTGYEVAQAFRSDQALARCTIVAVSGWGAKDDLARAQEAGFDMHFTKPVAPARVRAFLDSLH